MKNILLVNDDGYEATGIWAMQRALIEAGYTVTMVAPKRQQSWSGKSLFDHSPVTHEIVNIKDQEVHVIDATPAACVRIALHDMLKTIPLFVVSGINHGANDGIQFMMSSGTLGAALEASLDGVRSVAVSLAYAPSYKDRNLDLTENFQNAARVTVNLIKKLENYTFPAEIDALNLNVPYQLTNDDIAVCKHSRNSYGQIYKKDKDSIYTKNLLPEKFAIEMQKETDSYYLQKGQPALTPVSLDLASNDALSKLSNALS